MSKNSIIDHQEENVQFCAPYGFRHEMSEEGIKSFRKAMEEPRHLKGQMFYYFVPASIHEVEDGPPKRQHNIPSDFVERVDIFGLTDEQKKEVSESIKVGLKKLFRTKLS